MFLNWGHDNSSRSWNPRCQHKTLFVVTVWLGVTVIWRWRLRMVVRVHDQKSGCRHKVLLVHSTLSTTCQRLDHVDVLVIKRQSVPAGRPQGVEAPVQTAGSRHYVSDSSASVMKYKRVKNGAGTYRQAVSLVYTCIYWHILIADTKSAYKISWPSS